MQLREREEREVILSHSVTVSRRDVLARTRQRRHNPHLKVFKLKAIFFFFIV